MSVSLPYMLERVAPGIYYFLWTGGMDNVTYLKASQERVDMAIAHGSEPYVFIFETGNRMMQDWDLRVAQRGAEMEPLPIKYIIVTNNMMIQMAANILRLFLRLEYAPTREAAIARAEQLLIEAAERKSVVL